MKSTFLKLSTFTLAIVTGSLALAEGDYKTQDSAQKSQASQTVDQKMNQWSEQTKEAWRQGKLESVYLLNSHLSAYDIDTAVHGKTATLSGKVSSETAKELAEELALSIDGITEVENNLQIQSDYKPDQRQANKQDRSFGTIVSDATITADVKMKLIGSEVKARHVNVDTKNGQVTLTGEVESEAKAELAEKTAENAEGVVSVDNKLTINDQIVVR